MTQNKETGSEFLFWVGLITLVLSLTGLFASSQWISELSNEMFADLSRMGSDDSDFSSFAGTILFWTEFYIIKLIFWLKSLPVWSKVAGVIAGGWLSLSNLDY
jgi:hypothetical protein